MTRKQRTSTTRMKRLTPATFKFWPSLPSGDAMARAAEERVRAAVRVRGEANTRGSCTRDDGSCAALRLGGGTRAEAQRGGACAAESG